MLQIIYLECCHQKQTGSRHPHFITLQQNLLLNRRRPCEAKCNSLEMSPTLLFGRPYVCYQAGPPKKIRPYSRFTFRLHDRTIPSRVLRLTAIGLCTLFLDPITLGKTNSELGLDESVCSQNRV